MKGFHCQTFRCGYWGDDLFFEPGNAMIKPRVSHSHQNASFWRQEVGLWAKFHVSLAGGLGRITQPHGASVSFPAAKGND